MTAEKDIEVEEIITTVFGNFEELTKRLDKIPESAEKKTNALLKLFFDEKKDIFKSPPNFLGAINDLSEEIGHAYHTVLEIELKRLGLTPQNSPPSIPMPVTSDKTSPNLIVQTQPQKGGGFWDYFGTRKMAAIWEKYLKSSNQQFTPQISTSKEVVDILEFGRQLIPEFNRVIEYFQGCLDHLYFFNDEETRERLRSELCKHMNKLAGIIRSFCRTITEYRKELIGDRQSDIAKAVIQMKLAEYGSLGGMRTSDLYSAIREAMGAQDAGKR